MSSVCLLRNLPPNFLSFSLTLSHLSFSGAITPERQLP